MGYSRSRIGKPNGNEVPKFKINNPRDICSQIMMRKLELKSFPLSSINVLQTVVGNTINHVEYMLKRLTTARILYILEVHLLPCLNNSTLTNYNRLIFE